MLFNPTPLPMGGLLGSFPLAFPALFSRRVSIYAAAILLGSMWLGCFILAFFGISLGALRIAAAMR